MPLDPNYPYERRDRITVAACGECPLYVRERPGEIDTDFCNGCSPSRPIGKDYPFPDWCPLLKGPVKVETLWDVK